MTLITELAINIPVLMLIITGSGISIYFIKMWSEAPGYLKHRIRDRDETIKDLKHKYNVVNGKYARIRNEEFLDHDVLEDAKKKITADNPEDAVSQILDNVAPRLGKLGILAKNPMVRNLINQAMKKYPKESAEIVANLLPKLSQFSSSEETTSTVQRL